MVLEGKAEVPTPPVPASTSIHLGDRQERKKKDISLPGEGHESAACCPVQRGGLLVLMHHGCSGRHLNPKIRDQ